jgi:ubiquitin C-terminal hydrolase
MENLEEAFRAWLTPDSLDASNKWLCNKCDLRQTAKKGIPCYSPQLLLSLILTPKFGAI